MIVGDVDQLPSVGPGAVLADIIDSGSCANREAHRNFPAGGHLPDHRQRPPDQQGTKCRLKAEGTDLI